MSNVTQAWLADPTHILGLLVEITAKNVSTGTETTFYLSNIGYTTTSADVTYLPNLSGNIQTTESLTLDGSLSMSFGDIKIANYNGELDDWLDRTKYIWDSRAVQVYLGDPTWVAATLADVRTVFEKIFDGIIEDVDSSEREFINVKVRDKLNRLNYPISDNTLGIYGTWANGQTNQDTLRPLVFGEVFNMSPVLVDPAYLEYMFNDTNVGTQITSTTNVSTLISTTGTIGSLKGSLNQSYIPTFNSITGTGAANPYSQSYNSVPQKSTSGSGTGATFYITRSYTPGTGPYYGNISISIQSTGSGYAVGDTIVISGASIGGVNATNDLTVTVPSIASYNNTGIITGMTSTAGLSVGATLSATGGTGYLQSSSTVTSIISGTSISFTTSFGNTIAGSITNIYSPIPRINCTSTQGFVLDAPVVFTFSTTAYPSTFGNLVSGTTYYVKTIDSSTTFTVSATSGGSAFALTSASLTTTGSLINAVQAEVNVYNTELAIEIRDNGVPIYTDTTVYGTTVTSTAVTTNYITCVSTQNLSVGASIVFDTSIGNIVAGTTYYVKTIVSSTVFTISTLADGNTFVLTTATASGTIRVRNINRPDRAIVNLTTGKFTLKSPPDGTITMSLQGLKNSVDLSATGNAELLSTYTNNIGNIITLIVTQYGQVNSRMSSSDLDLVNLRSFVVANTAAVGIALKDRVNVLEVCQKLARSANAQLFFNRLGKLQLLQLGTYTSDTVMSITDGDILHHSLHISNKTKVIAATKVGYALNYTPQTALAGSIPSDANYMFNDEWYSKTITDTAVQSTYKLTAAPVQTDTNLIRGVDATALATTLNDYFKVPRTVYAFTGTAKLLYLKLGQQVTLTHNRFGLTSGKTGQVITLSPNWADGTINVEVII